MLRPVLPLISLGALAAVDTSLPVTAVKAVVEIDVDVVASPAATPAPGPAPSRSQGQSGPPGKHHPRHVSRIGIGGIRISRRPIDHHGVVGGNINHVRLGLLDDDDLFATLRVCFYFMLRAGF
jgi:hypothetical protein